MYSEHRKAPGKLGNVINSEPASDDQSIMQNVFGLLQDYVPQAVAGPREERKERVLWATFESCVEDFFPECQQEVGDGSSVAPLLLILGFATGYSVWLVQPRGDAQEVYCAHGEGEAARIVRVLRRPDTAFEGASADRFAQHRPIIAVVKKGRYAVPYSTVQFASLRRPISEEEEGPRKIMFKGKTIVDLKCNNSQQDPEPTSANIVSIVDVGYPHGAESMAQQSQQQEIMLQDMPRGSGVVAHFLAHSGQGVNIAALEFNQSGSLLVTACTEGHSFHVFSVLPHPWLSSETSVHHLYTLQRGATSGVVQDICFSNDSRWVAVSTLNGTTHVFPIAPYGGSVTVRTHMPPNVVNRLSRFHTSAGIESIPPTSQALPFSSSSSSSSSSSAQPHGPHRLSASPPSCEPAPPSNVGGGSTLGGPWNNPRGPPLPLPVVIHPLKKIKQPYLPSSAGEGSVAGGGPGPSAGPAGAMHRPAEVVEPDGVCVRAVFGLRRALGRSSTPEPGSAAQSASYLLYVVGSNGVLTQHLLEPQRKPNTNEGEDAPIELTHSPLLCWKLLSKPHSGTMTLPLSKENPLLVAFDKHKEYTSDGTCKAQQQQQDKEWLSQVEILTHAPPSRRLWMGPQFSFKPYPASSTGNTKPFTLQDPGAKGTDSLLGAPQEWFMNSGRGSDELAGASVNSAVLSTSNETPFVDHLLTEPSENVFTSLHSSSLPMPVREDGMDSGPASLEKGMVEVFGSWKTVAPRLESTLFQEMEKQLAEAMSEQQARSGPVMVAQGTSFPMTGFHPPGEND